MGFFLNGSSDVCLMVVPNENDAVMVQMLFFYRAWLKTSPHCLF
jgi:hypothetical protein